MMKKTILAVALLAASAGAFAQSRADADRPDAGAPQAGTFAQSRADADGSWLVRFRVLQTDSLDRDSTGQHLMVNNSTVYEADVTYFFTPNLAAEALIGPRMQSDVTSRGIRIGSYKALSPTVLGQYHFTGLGQFNPALAVVKPYLGVGVNYSRFTSVDLLLGYSNITRSSFGPVLQAGADLAVTKNIYLNLDVKKAWGGAKVTILGTDVGTFRPDPMLFGLGVGYRF